MRERFMKEVNYIIRPYQKGEEDYVADAHARVYGEEYNWSDIFIACSVFCYFEISQYSVWIFSGFCRTWRMPDFSSGENSLFKRWLLCR